MAEQNGHNKIPYLDTEYEASMNLAMVNYSFRET